MCLTCGGVGGAGPECPQQGCEGPLIPKGSILKACRLEGLGTEVPRHLGRGNALAIKVG